jgi:D-alanyl-D-alanine carboxypeptidase
MSNTVSKPYAVTINEHSSTAFAQAAALIRLGYTFTEAPPTVYETNGQASISLVLGTPDEHAVKAAEATMNTYAQLAEAARQREIEAAAKQMIAAIQRDEAKAAVQAQIDEQEKALRKLKDQAKKI